MSLSARNGYLVTQVQTASPQKLQLMLLDAAIRSAQRGRLLRQDHRDQDSLQSILHAQAVVTELLAGIDRQQGGDLAEQVSAIYNFIFQRLVQAGRRNADPASLDDAIRVLEIERETWRQLCDQLAGAGRAFIPAPHKMQVDAFEAMPQNGFSIEA